MCHTIYKHFPAFCIEKEETFICKSFITVEICFNFCQQLAMRISKTVLFPFPLRKLIYPKQYSAKKARKNIDIWGFKV